MLISMMIILISEVRMGSVFMSIRYLSLLIICRVWG